MGDATTLAGAHLTLPAAAATGPLPLPPKAGEEGKNQGRLLANLMHFARTLRAAGLPVGPGKVIDAVQAVLAVGITDRRDFYWTLHAVFVNRPDQRLIFDQAFHVFWRNPDLLKKMMALVLPEMRVPGEEDRGAEMARRLAEALHPNRDEPAGEPEEVETEIDAVMTFSDREQLRGMDFEKMSLDELARAKAAIARLRLPVQDVPTRRFAPDRHGARADLRATLRAALRSGGLIELKRKSRAPPPAAARRTVRHLGLDEPLQPHLSAFHAHGHQRPRPGLHLCLRHPADQHHPLSAPPRRGSGAGAGRRGGRRLVGRNPHRPFDRRVQPAVVAPPFGPGRDRHA